jgi:hypothetical protein
LYRQEQGIIKMKTILAIFLSSSLYISICAVFFLAIQNAEAKINHTNTKYEDFKIVYQLKPIYVKPQLGKNNKN